MHVIGGKYIVQLLHAWEWEAGVIGGKGRQMCKHLSRSLPH